MTDSATEDHHRHAAPGQAGRRSIAQLWVGRRPLQLAFALAVAVVVVQVVVRAEWDGAFPDIARSAAQVPVDDPVALVALIVAVLAVAGLTSEGAAMIMLLCAGVFVGAVWRLLASPVAEAGNPLEAAASTDGVLALIHVVVGVATAAWVLVRPGDRPAVRTVVTILGAAVAGVVSWKIGDWLVAGDDGSPPLRATGAAFVWSIVTAGGLFAGAFFPGLSRRLDR